MPTPTPGHPGYRERLTVPWWWWLAAAAAVVVLGAEVGVSVAWGIGATAVLGAVALVLLAGLSWSRVSVHEGELRAGSARIPVRRLGRPQLVEGEQLRRRLGPEADPTAFLLVRWWIHRAVEVAVLDPHADPPYWLISTRHPEALAAALTQAAAAPHHSTGE
jgi:hypothetical protein